ncbi:CGGC domain-containing protein [Desulfoscipio gibsoniae]|uniref:Putative metal-binding protein n=1 Tax=Desulfoscipio gibsoniae DSM 7213 TaxID=767817 RepID=R4KM35_9FIRM|nr:CGGC domain-containing protein [Desulfoscipio gibsoniae]AGL00706.1 putative metal-binding protein [Desulfoscipio gibsoniae DSM 7213]
MANILIVTCAKIRDVSCIACLKCFKAANLKEGEFAQYDTVNIVGMSGCGDCPGLVMPKVGLVMEMADYLEQDVDAIHLGTCMVRAGNTAACPIDLAKVQQMLSSKYGLPVVIGTHSY